MSRKNNILNDSLLSRTLANIIAQSVQNTGDIDRILKGQGYSPTAPVQSPTINNAPPVGQSGNVEPLPFFKYQPPVGQNTINFNPRALLLMKLHLYIKIYRITTGKGYSWQCEMSI